MSAFGRSAVIIALSLLAAACGKKGALIYPDMLVPAAPAGASAQQSGSAVKLQFTLPDKDRAGRPVHGVAGVKISRLVADTDRKDFCNSCMTDYRLFRTLYLDRLPADTQRFGSRLVVLDSDVSAGNRYSYRMVPFTVDNVEGAISPAADVRVAPPLPAPGVKIAAFPTEVKLYLSLQPLQTGQLLGYNLYRASGAASWPYQPFNRAPFNGTVYSDTTLERGVQYRYTVRAVIRQPSGDVAESMPSEEVAGKLTDDE